MKNGSIGQLLDEYLADYPYFETVFFYHDKEANLHLVVTNAVDARDGAYVFSEAIDVRQRLDEAKKELSAIEAKVRSKQREHKQVESAIKKLVRYKD